MICGTEPYAHEKHVVLHFRCKFSMFIENALDSSKWFGFPQLRKGKVWFLKRAMGEENGETTFRGTARFDTHTYAHAQTQRFGSSCFEVV